MLLVRRTFLAGICVSQDSRQILRALTFGLMELQGCKAFRQSSITDRVVHGRKLRAWQVPYMTVLSPPVVFLFLRTCRRGVIP